MKILIINTGYAPNVYGGAEQSVQNLAEGLAFTGHEVHAVSLTEARPWTWSEIGGVTIHYLPLRNIRFPFGKRNLPPYLAAPWHLIDTWNPLAARDLASLCRQLQPDVVHTNRLTGFSCSAWQAASRRSAPIVHTLRDYYLLHPNNTMFTDEQRYHHIGPVARAYAMPRKWLSAVVDQVVGNSRFTLEQHTRAGYFPNAEKHVIANIFEPKAAKGKRPRGPLRFGYIGRLDPPKGLDLLIREFPADLDNELRIAGTGEPGYVAQLKSQAEGKPIAFLGHQKPDAFYTEIDILVVPSVWHEPLPRVIFEANSYGIPVLGSNRGGIPEMIEQGRNGWIFDPAGPNALNRKITEIAAQPDTITPMAKPCLSYARKFSPDVITTQYLEVYRQAISQTRPES
ncbi:MAG: glycosyltransferase family 4 protein [Opitutales bacterium]